MSLLEWKKGVEELDFNLNLHTFTHADRVHVIDKKLYILFNKHETLSNTLKDIKVAVTHDNTVLQSF